MSKKQQKQNEDCVDVIVVGGGAAGLMAAIAAARGGARVTVLEHMEQAGKKLLMTGNGKCNFTNEAIADLVQEQDAHDCEKYYHGAAPAFVLPALKKADLQFTLNFFEGLGIRPVKRRGGFYPAGGQASGILAVMLMECERLGILIECNVGIRTIRKAEKDCTNQGKNESYFVIETKTGTYFAKKCILATGGKSYRKSGSDGSGFLYVERLGHHIQDLVPALVPLQSELAFFKKCAGIRAEISLKIDTKPSEICERGELQLTDYGVSGICVFQISSYASRALAAGENVQLELSFLPEYTDAQAYALLEKQLFTPCAANKTCAQALIGLFPDRLGAALLEEADISPAQAAAFVSREQLQHLTDTICHFIVPVTTARSFEQAQVTAGGVDTAQVCAETMESKVTKGLYFAGEMLDVDGICGGFNLQWAWSSGAVAGMHAAAAVCGTRTGDHHTYHGADRQ